MYVFVADTIISLFILTHKKRGKKKEKKREKKGKKRGVGKKRERSLLLNFLLGKFLNLKKKEKLMRFGD
jgi:hypothetical protein